MNLPYDKIEIKQDVIECWNYNNKSNSERKFLCYILIEKDSERILLKVIFRESYVDIINSKKKMLYEREFYKLIIDAFRNKKCLYDSLKRFRKYREIEKYVNYIIFLTNNKKVLSNIIYELNDFFIPKLTTQVENLEKYIDKLSRYAINYILCSDEKYIGLLSYYVNLELNELYITLIGITKYHQNKHLGKVLLNLVFYEAEVLKIKIIRLEVQKNNIPAIQFYIKNGFLYEKNASENSIYLQYIMQEK